MYLNFKKVKIVGMTAVATIAGIVTAYCSRYEYGNRYLVDEEGNKVIDQGYKEIYFDHNLKTDELFAKYMVSNRWPKWFPLYQEKYGLINIENRTATEPRFSDSLDFRMDGFAWDYDGHYVDQDGNIAVDCKYYGKDERFLDNPRKFALFALGTGLTGKNIEYLFTMVQEAQSRDTMYDTMYYQDDFGTYSEGLSSYLEMRQGGYYHSYGYIDMDGNVAIPAQYDQAGTFDENGFAIVKKPVFGQHGYALINTKGEEILGEDCDRISRDFSSNYYIFERDRKNGLADSQGKEILECKYYYIDTIQDRFIVTREDRDSTYVCMDENLNILCETKYCPCDYDNNAGLFVVHVSGYNSDSVKSYIDGEGNLIDNPAYEELDYDWHIPTTKDINEITGEGIVSTIDSAITEDNSHEYYVVEMEGN